MKRNEERIIPKPKKGGNYTLMYSRRIHDKRIYNTNYYKPHFLDILAQRCIKEIEQARKRVVITNEGRYIYFPTKEYVEFRENFSKQIIKKSNEDIKHIRGNDSSNNRPG